MSDVWPLLIAYAPLFAWGSTALLAGGCVCIALTRSPVHRQRIGELTLWTVAAWLLLSLAPLPRLVSPQTRSELPQPRGAVSEATFPSDLPLAPELREGETGPAPLLLPEPAMAPPIAVLAEPVRDPPEQSAKRQANVTSRVIPLQTSLPEFQLSEVLLVAMIGGAGICLSSLALGHAMLLRLRFSAAPPPWLGDLYQGLLAKSPDARARLLVSRRTKRALSFGVWSPVIVLPQSLCRCENDSQLQAVLWHELGHVAQRDAWGNLLLSLALPLLYWNPLYWWLRGQMQLAAELVADDWAAVRTGKEAYVEQLVALVQTLHGNELSLVGVAGVFSVPSQFYRRMDMLLARETPLATRPSARWRMGAVIACGCIVLAAALTAGVRPAPAQPPAVVPPPVAIDPAAPPATPPKADPAPVVPPAPTTPAVPALGPPNPVAPPPSGTAPADERARVLDQIRELQDRLKALETVNHRPPPLASPPAASGLPAASPAGKLNRPAARIATLIRTDEKGRLIQEVWSLDESGRPDKLIEQRAELPGGTIAVPSTGYPIGIANPPATEAAGAPPKGAGATPPANWAVNRLATRPATEATASVGSAKQLDLVALATSYADAVGALELAKAQLATLEPLAKANSVSHQELTTARLGQQNAQRKEQLLRRIAEVALTSAKQEMERDTKAYQNGLIPASAAAEAQARVEILQQILGSSGENKPKTPSGAENAPSR